MTFNHGVEGSSPSALTKKINDFAKVRRVISTRGHLLIPTFARLSFWRYVLIALQCGAVRSSRART